MAACALSPGNADLVGSKGHHYAIDDFLRDPRDHTSILALSARACAHHVPTSSVLSNPQVAELLERNNVITK